MSWRNDPLAAPAAPAGSPATPWANDPIAGPTPRQVLTTAVTMKPDSVAEAERLAKRYPAPPEVIMQDLEAYRLQEVLDLADTDLQKAPMLREIMRRDVKVAAMAQDDIPMLSRVAQAARDVANIGKAGVFGASRGVAGTVRAGLELVAPVLDVLEPLDPNAASPGLIPRVAFPGGNPLRRLAEGFGMQAAAAGQTADAAMPRYESTLGQGVASGLRSLTQNLMTLPMAFLPGGQGAALAGMTTFTGGDAYQQAREKGIPMSQALPFAASQAAVEYATEKLPLAALLKDVKVGTGFLQILGRQIALEVPGEQVATLLQDLNEWAVINPEKPFSSYLEERPSAAAQTLIATIVGTGGNVAVVKGIERLVERATRDGTNMQRAGLAAQALEQAMKGAEASRLRERSPDQFRAVMSEMSQDGTLYVDAEVLNQMPAEVLSQMEGVVDALPDALAANAPVAVKLADALTLLPGTPQAEVFMQNARTSPDAPSLVEAETAGQKAQEFLQQEAQRVIEQAADQEALRQSQELVKTNIKEQLAATGRFRDAVNEGYATWAAAFYTAYGSRLGMTPEQFYQRYPLRVLGAPVGQQTGVLNAGEQKPGQLDGIEAYHWSMAARPTLSSAFYGTGLRGSARDEIMSYPDQRVRQRLSFYVDKGTGVRPEAGVGGVAHRATLNNIYDANLDPLKLRGGNAREFETRVLDAGFDGYLDRLEGDQPGQVILLGDRTVQPEVLGPLSRVESGQQVPALARREAPWQTQASGTPEQLQARLERMQSSPAWGDYDLRIEGNELQVRKKGGVFEQKAKEPDSNVKLPKKATTTTAVDLRNGPRLTGSQKMSIHEVAAFFDKITGKRDFNDPKEQKRAVKQIVAELQYQLQREQSGLDWYEGDIKAAFEATATVIPSLAESATKRQLFAVVAGLQSPGTLADLNWDIAAQAFQHYEKTGTIPGRNPANGNLWAGGPTSLNKEKALEFLNAMVQDLGEQNTVEWLYSEHTVKELNEARRKWGNMGPGVDGKASDLKLGMFAFGPKVGPFVMNINGIHELTVDLWATRSFNRYFGQMTGPDGKIVDAPTEPQRRVVKELFNAAAEQVGIKPYQVQSVLWFFEQQLFNHLGTGSASLSFSDGARKFAERSLPAPGRDGGPATLRQGGLSGRPQQAGDGAGRYSSGSLAPLEGAPNVAGAAGPDPRLVAVAEQYARDNGIPLRRQAAYAKVDPERAARIAAAYEAMPHAPQDPAVREAYDDLARQTMAQYQALVDAGYQFWFMDPAADPYQGNPWNAMRDLRANQSMAVFPTESGFGTGEFDPEGNPLLADTGLEWAYGSPDGETKRVLFNDLFRAVHDAFGHGLEGAGFRAQGEENAWQAHVRLFTGPAVGAITSETRGQNSWLNYGPYGEKNRTAAVEDTVFADQKTGLMPEWTWSEGRVADEQQVLEQRADQTQTPEFKRWFGDSRAVVAVNAETGQPVVSSREPKKLVPQVMYHTTRNDFTEFEIGRITTNSGTFGSWNTSRAAVFVTPDLEASQAYGTQGGEFEPGANVMPLYIKAENPLDLTNGLSEEAEQKLLDAGMFQGFVNNRLGNWSMFDDEDGRYVVDMIKKAGYDSVIFNDENPDTGDSFEAWALFDPTQIKSAIGNQGTFDPADPNILKQQARGTFNPQTLELVLNPNADLSTWFHETGHFFLEVLADVASQPGAPAQITDDYNKVLAWFGVTPEQWAGYSLDEKRPYHERWAESIEQYVMEGKAPSVELQGVMRRFRAWLTSVYQSIKQFVAGKPELELNDDIRRVMDRMLATDEQIAQANEVAGFMPDEQADGEAAERLQKRSIADLKWSVKARDKVIAKLKKQAREVEKATREQVTAEVDQMPEVQAKDMLAKTRKENGRELNDVERAVIADAFGYESVDAMLQAIDAFGSKKDAIDGLTEQRMLEENGDLIDERAIQEAANEAVHNEARARSLATELRTQREMLGQRTDTGEVNAKGARITVNALVEAAKQFGANVIARTPLKDLKATAWKHTAAERRAGKRWAEATAKGETQEAVQAKQDQVLNNAAAKAAIDAATEAKKILEFFKRVTKGNDEKTVEKGRDPDIVNAARAVLAAYGVETPASKNAAAYLETVKANDPDTYSAIEPMIAAATQNAQPLEALTFEELQGLAESIRAMWFLAKRSRQMEVAGDLLDIDDVAQDLYTRLEEIGIPDRVAGEGMAVTQGEERTLFLQQGIAFLRRVEQWAEGMDGKYGGPFLRFIFQPIKDAADRYRKERIDYRKKFQALVDNLAPIVGDSVIQAPELGYTFGTPGSTTGTAMNEILHAIAHTGNDSNKRKLLLGRGWATENPDGTLDTSRWDAFIRRLVNEGKLERAHFDFVQGVWDLLEETKPLAQKAHRDAFGRYFSEVTANAFVDPFGVTRRGGYVPAQVDSRQVKDNALRKLAEEENNSMAYAFPQPAMGFTKGRTEYNKPLMLDLRTLSQHLDKVLLFSHMTVPARDVRKLLMRPKVNQPLNRVQPAAIESMLQPWLQRSAQQIVEDPIVGSGKWARIPGIVRSRAGMALMFANVSNAIQQITGLAGAAVRVKPSYLMRSLAQYVASPVKFSRAVWDASPYMDDRAKNEVAVMNEQMQAILIKPSTFQKAQDFSMRHAYFLQTALDNVLSPIVWTGALNQALADGMSEQDAIRFADSTVRQTQGSTLPEDVSRFETGPAYARAFTQFVSYFNMMANTNGTALKQIAGEVGLKKGAGKALYVVMMGLMAPIWVAEAIALAFKGGPEDEDDDGYLDDWLAAVFGMGTTKGLLAQIPILGQFGVAAANRFNDNPLDDRVSLSPAISLLESSVSAPESVYKAIVEDGSAQKAIRDVATLVSVATGVPVYGLARPIGYAAGVAQGKIEPTGPVDVARGLVTGTASPESKVR